MLRAVADTAAVIWYIFADDRLSTPARNTIEQIGAAGDSVGFSSITLAEIIYLIEQGRLAASTLDRLLGEVEKQDALLVEVPFDRQVARAMQQAGRIQMLELPDRIIAATALCLDLPLISRDLKIQQAGVDTIW